MIDELCITMMYKSLRNIYDSVSALSELVLGVLFTLWGHQSASTSLLPLNTL